jgi:hypothetical protein
MKRALVPRSATWLLERFLPATHREVILGDLIEEYAMESWKQERKASWRVGIPLKCTLASRGSGGSSTATGRT